MSVNEPAWLAEARKNLGVTEIKGPKTNDFISRWLVGLAAWWSDDETPWCAAFVGGCLEAVGITCSRFESARSYESWGSPLSAPLYGCIVTFTRDGGGHVGFVVGRDASGNLMVLGGNQGDAVNVKAFPRSRATAYRWPMGVPADVGAPLPLLAAAELSTNEA